MNRIYDTEVEKQASMVPHMDVSDPAGARRTLAEFMESIAAQGIVRPSDPAIDEVERTIPGPQGAPDIPIRIYMPKNRDKAGPAFINFHAGGFIFGDLEMEHSRCLLMAAAGGAVSVGVDYRLAPENPFPAGVEDCYTALQWVAANSEELKIDPARIVIGGSSAGGGLTGALALMTRDRSGAKVAFQMLFFPVTDSRCQTNSMKNGTGLYVWDYQNSLEMWNQYIGSNHQSVSPYAAPALAENFSGLPPAYIVTAEHDPLRDEGINFAMQLMAAGVPVELHNYPGTTHCFDFLTMTDISARALYESVEAFKRAVSK